MTILVAMTDKYAARIVQPAMHQHFGTFLMFYLYCSCCPSVNNNNLLLTGGLKLDWTTLPSLC